MLVDEKSLKEVGRWPWPRDKQALLVDQIHAGEPAVLGLDIIYAEPEESDAIREIKSWLASAQQKEPFSNKLLERLEARLHALDTDQQFAESLARAGNIVLAMPFFVLESQTTDSLIDTSLTVPELLKRSEFMLVKQTKSAQESHPYEATALLPPLDTFAQQAKGIGHVYRLPDHDGITRREVLALRHEDAYYPSFSLEVARLYLGRTREHMTLLLGDGVKLARRSYRRIRSSECLLITRAGTAVSLGVRYRCDPPSNLVRFLPREGRPSRNRCVGNIRSAQYTLLGQFFWSREKCHRDREYSPRTGSDRRALDRSR